MSWAHCKFSTSQERFEESDVKLLGLAASFSASALAAQKLRQEAEAARLVFRELEIAREVQLRLFPSHPPRVPGLDIAAYCRPANFVGGDYYDFLYRPDSDLWFTIGDVSGKGISAAVLMASLQASLRSQLNGHPDSVANVVSELNQAVCSSFGQERYTTLFCGRLDPVDWSLTYVNAGQVQPLLLRSSGEAYHLDCGGVPVGLFDSATYEHASIRLQPGDLLACFSDGITEARNRDGQMWDESELTRYLMTTCTAALPNLSRNWSRQRMTIWEPRNKLMTSLSSYFAFSTEQITAAVPKRESRS